MFVQNGGTLLVAAGVAGPVDSDLCGMEIQPELWAGTAWKWKEEPFMAEAYRYCPSKVIDVKNVEIIAQTESGNPLITTFKSGKGMVYTCLVPWYEGVSALFGAASRLFDEVIIPLQKVIVEGLPIHWTFSQKEGELFVALSNSSNIEWKGRVKVPDTGLYKGICRELLTNTNLTTQRKSKQRICDLAIPAFDVRVISIS